MLAVMGDPTEGDDAAPPAEHHCPVCDRLRAHVRHFFPQNEIVELPAGGPIAASNPHFGVLRVAPVAPTDLWTYFSIGAWAARPDQQPGVEFVLTVATDEERAVDLLAMSAYYHEEHPLEWGQLVPIGEPWLTGSSCGEFLLSTPYPFSPDMQTCHVDDERRVDFLWLLPVTDAESEYMDANGQEALESRFDEIGLEYWDVARASAI